MNLRRVKYPIGAAAARFLPIYNHLANMAEYLDQASLQHPRGSVLSLRHLPAIAKIKEKLEKLERQIKPLAALEKKTER